MGYRDELSDLIAPAERVLEQDLVSLETRAPDRRVRRYEEIKDNERHFEEYFRDQYRDQLNDVTAADVRGQFATARLFLHVASRRDDRADPLDPDAFTDDEVQAAVEFDRYRAFDVADEEDLQRRIRNKDEEIYEFVVDEIATQTENRSSVLESQDNRVRKSIMDYLNQRYQKRLDRAEEAVSLYVQYHGLPNVVERIEEAVEATAEGSLTRQEVERAVESQLEDLSERLHATLRDQERAIRNDIASVEGELASVGAEDVEVEVDTDDLAGRLRAIEQGIESVRKQRRDDVAALEEAIEELSEQRDQIEAKIDDLETTSETVVREAASDAAREAASDAAESVSAKADRVVGEEVERLEERRAAIDSELDRLQRERKRLEAAGERLADEQETLQDRVERVSSSLPDEGGDLASEDSDVIPARVARLYEIDFVSRFDQSIQEAAAIALPDGDSFEPGEHFAEQANESGDERARMASLLADQNRETEPVDHYPLRRWSRYTVAESSRFGLFSEAKLVVEASVHSNLGAYAANGFDARPAGLDDLLEVVNDATARAREEEIPHLVAVASTTGWTDRVRELVADAEFSRTHLGPDVSLCLVDLRTGDLLYDGADELVRENRQLFERAVHVERVDRCEAQIREGYLDDPMTDTVLLGSVAEDLDVPEHVVDSAFDRIADAGDATRRYHAERGPYLVVDRA